MSATFILGIDPGKEGAIGRDDGQTWDMPVGAHGLVTILEEAVGTASRDEVLVVIEQQQAMPGNGAATNYVIGHGMGVIEGACAAMRLPYRTVRPGVWKRAFGLKAGDKEAARAKARELFPHAELHLKKHHGRAEALLLCEWGRRQPR